MDNEPAPHLSAARRDEETPATLATLATLLATSQAQGTKRKQQSADNDDGNEPINSRPSKKSKPAVTKPPSGTKRSAADAELDDESNLQMPLKRGKIGSATKITSGSKSDGEAGKRSARGRPEQDHEGKKCCNTCQGWKELSQFAIKKHSKIAGATVGYCMRCQTNKQAKNKAKADAKKGVTKAGGTCAKPGVSTKGTTSTKSGITSKTGASMKTSASAKPRASKITGATGRMHDDGAGSDADSDSDTEAGSDSGHDAEGESDHLDPSQTLDAIVVDTKQ